MANPKRASMREGPLAALFRKTEDGEQEPAPAAGAKGERASSSRKDSPPVHPRESGLPHPALSASAEEPEPQAHVATPRERLRHAFSSEIPSNVMDRPAARPVMDDYSREHPAATGVGSAGPVGQPLGAWLLKFPPRPVPVNASNYVTLLCPERIQLSFHKSSNSRRA